MHAALASPVSLTSAPRRAVGRAGVAVVASARMRVTAAKKAQPTVPLPAAPATAATAASTAAFWFSALPALAEDAPIPAPSLPFNLSPFEVAIAFAPVAFYAVLTVYRNFVNPKASISDVLFLVAAFLIVGNLISGLVFKVRLF